MTATMTADHAHNTGEKDKIAQKDDGDAPAAYTLELEEAEAKVPTSTTTATTTTDSDTGIRLSWRSWMVVFTTCFAIVAQVFVVTAAGSVIAFIIRDLGGGDSGIAGWVIREFYIYKERKRKSSQI
jgi:hypothetical protein